ncbi:transcription factor [Fusarium sporotrichioides]|uniref:Transcription factor n=1 Tax=Fusarium sporotrichioides TaxID=5514 RepID=A0A395SJF0_FUSSP|nr:transcription factor [Fusarium sporotrichioides]
MPNISDPNRKLIKVEELISSPPNNTRTPPTGPEIITTEEQAAAPGKSQSEEPPSSLVKDNSGHHHYIGPSGTLNFWNQLRNLVDSNDSQANPGRQGATKFTQDNTTRLLEADGQDEDDQPQRSAVWPQDGPSPGSMTSAIARDFTRLPTADMDDILSQFPPNEVLEQLIQSYFTNVHDDFPLFHRASFEEEYEIFIVQARRDPRIPNSRPLPLPDWGWIGCLHMIVVFGSISDRSIPNIDHSALRRRSVTVARTLLPQFISKCSLSNVRVLLLLALFLHNNNERNAAWNMAGTATRISFALGLHRLDMSSSFRPLEREVRKWVFCTLYAFEQFLASSLGRPSGLQELDVEVVPPREDFVEGGIGTDARLVSWSVKLQAILARTRLLHGVNRSPGPKLDEIMDALDGWKRDIGKAPGLDVAWMKLEGRALPSLDEDGAVDMEELKVSLAWKTAPQLRAVLLMHIQFHYIAIVATRPLLLRDVASTRKADVEAPKAPVPTHAALCVKHACQLSYLMILLDHFDVINGLSGLDIFYAYCSAMILILRLLRLRPGELVEGVKPDEVALQSKIRRIVETLRNVINHTEKCGSMARLAQVVDTFSECANNSSDPPAVSSLPPQGNNTNSMSYPPGWPAQQMQPPQDPQVQGIGSMDGLLNFLPFPGLGTGEGSMAQFVPGSDVEVAGWPEMEFLMEGARELKLVRLTSLDNAVLTCEAALDAQSVATAESLVAQLALSSSAVNLGCSSIGMPLRSQELFHYFYRAGSTLGISPKDPTKDCLAFIISNPEALRSAVLMAGIHFAFNVGTLSKFETTFLYHKIETVQQVRKLVSRADLKSLAGITKQLATLAYAEVCRGDIKLAETHLSAVYALSNRPRHQEDDQGKTLDQELSDRYFLLSSAFVHGLKSVLKGVASEQGIEGDIYSIELNKTISLLHNFHLNAGQFAHQLKLKAVRLIPAFFNAPYSGAHLLDVDYRPILECLKGVEETVSSKEQDEFWLYGQASSFYDNMITAHLNSIYYEGADNESNTTTPEDLRCMTSWCALMVAVELYCEQVVTLWRPFKMEIFLHSLRILQRDVTFAMRKSGSLQLPELILWESFVGLVGIRGHEKEGDMGLEPGLRPSFEEIVRTQSKAMRLYTWQDVRGALKSILWPLSKRKDGYMTRIWETAMAGAVDPER